MAPKGPKRDAPRTDSILPTRRRRRVSGGCEDSTDGSIDTVLGGPTAVGDPNRSGTAAFTAGKGSSYGDSTTMEGSTLLYVVEGACRRRSGGSKMDVVASNVLRCVRENTETSFGEQVAVC